MSRHRPAFALSTIKFVVQVVCFLMLGRWALATDVARDDGATSVPQVSGVQLAAYREDALAAARQADLIASPIDVQPYYDEHGQCAALALEFPAGSAGDAVAAALYAVNSPARVQQPWQGRAPHADSDLLAAASLRLAEIHGIKVTTPDWYLYLGDPSRIWGVYQLGANKVNQRLVCNLSTLECTTLDDLLYGLPQAPPSTAVAKPLTRPIRPGGVTRPQGGPVVLHFQLAGGAAGTNSRYPAFDNQCQGNPKEMLYSTRPDFAYAYWQSYRPRGYVWLESISGRHFVYFKVRDAQGVESPVVTDSIELVLPRRRPLVIDAAALKARIDWPGLADTYTLNVPTTQTLRIATGAAGLNNTTLELRGPAPSQNLVTRSTTGGAGRMAAIQWRLKPGRYEVVVTATDPTTTGDFLIWASSRPVPPVATNLRVANGASSTTRLRVPVTVTTSGGATHAQLSTRADFADARWQTLQAPLSFLLPADVPERTTVYLRVCDAASVVSSTISAPLRVNIPWLKVDGTTITLPVSTSLYTHSFRMRLSGRDAYRFTLKPLRYASVHLSLCGPGTDEDPRIASASMSQATPLMMAALPPAEGIYFLQWGSATNGPYQLHVGKLPLRLLSFRLWNQPITTVQNVWTHLIYEGRPTHLMFSESPTFAGASWLTNSNFKDQGPYWPYFMLSLGNGPKTVYCKLKDTYGRESNVLSASIVLELPPVFRVTSLSFNGETIVRERRIRFSFDCEPENSEAAIMISEAPNFAGADWQSAALREYWFELSAGFGLKTIYIKARAKDGRISEPFSRTIELRAIPPVITSTYFGCDDLPENLGRGVKITWSDYPNGTHYMLSDSASFAGAQWMPYELDHSYGGRAVFLLPPREGLHTIYLKLRHEPTQTESATKTLTYDLQAPALQPSALEIERDRPVTADRRVTLGFDLPSWQVPSWTETRIGERADLADARWQPAAEVPIYNLSPGNGLKTVYVQLRNWAGEESPVLSDTIELRQTIVPIKVGQHTDGELVDDGEVDWYQFQIVRGGRYRVQLDRSTEIALRGPASDLLPIVPQPGGSETRRYFTLQPGIYYLRLGDPADYSWGKYSVVIIPWDEGK